VASVAALTELAKFGVLLTPASQRPHDISPTIISQPHNYFLRRLVNNLDVHAIEKAVAYLDRVSFESLPILPTGVCVLAGVSAQVPGVVKIGSLPAEVEPNSRTMSVTDHWLRAPDELPSASFDLDDDLEPDDDWGPTPEVRPGRQASSRR
jgi:DNA helicase HerA-like ATPase